MYIDKSSPESTTTSLEVKKMETLYGTLEFSDIQPKKLKTLVPTIILPGWGETYRTFEEVSKAVANTNRRVISISHSREDTLASIREEETVANESLHEELQKAHSIIEIIRTLEVDQVDVVAHSEGAINATIAASIEPAMFRSIILVTPAGFMREDSFLRLAVRYAIDLKNRLLLSMNDHNGRIARSVDETFEYLRSNVIKSLKEGREIASVHLQGLISKLESHGIPIVILHAINDQVFPIKNIQALIQGDYVRAFYPLEGGHNGIYRRPQKYAKVIDTALSQATEHKRAS